MVWLGGGEMQILLFYVHRHFCCRYKNIIHPISGAAPSAALQGVLEPIPNAFEQGDVYTQFVAGLT